MPTFINLLFNLFTTSPGNLAYHVILVFSILAALVSAYNLWRSSEFPQGQRMVMGLSLLLISRLALFLIGAYTLNETVNQSAVLPPLDRGATALGLILIVWLWAFPEPRKFADIATSLVGFLSITYAILSTLIWNTQFPNETFFNNTWLNTVWEGISIAIIIIGLILLFVRRPNSWGLGLSMLGLSLIGHVSQLTYPQINGDFPGVVRFFQISAYPFLLTLSQRFPFPVTKRNKVITTNKAPQPKKRYNTNPDILNAFFTLWVEEDKSNLYTSITQTISRTVLADISMVLSNPDKQGDIVIQSGYDLIQEQHIPGSIISTEKLPVLSSALIKGKPIRLPASSTSPDLQNLYDILGINKTGPLLMAPIALQDSDPIASICLLSPYSHRSWNKQDQQFLERAGQVFAKILIEKQSNIPEKGNHSLLVQELENQLAKTITARDNLREENRILLEEINTLREEVEELPSEEETLEPLMEAHKQNLEKIKTLEAELGATRQQLSEYEEMIEAFELNSDNQKYYEKELHSALEEIAQLQNLLGENENKISELEKQTISNSNDRQSWDLIANMIQELRQPLSAVMGYSDFLLSESVGLLGALQRKFLEKVKTSTGRLNTMVDDLLQVTAMEYGQIKLDLEAIDLNPIIDDAINQCSHQMREKNIVLRFDIPFDLPTIYGDKDAIRHLLVHLLQNAGESTPNEGEVLVSTRVETYGDEQGFVLIQVEDSGGGIPTEDLPQVFENRLQTGKEAIQGLGDSGIGLYVAKSLVEAHGGRIWVDTEKEKGSIFSILLPLTQELEKDLQTRSE